MDKFNLNDIPLKVKEKEITSKEAINLMASFISLNYPVFGLHHYDEDFREELILRIIERGDRILSSYNQTQGDFFNYLFCYISSTIRTMLRTYAKRQIMETVAFAENSYNLEEKQYNYNHINYHCLQAPKIPYAKVNITEEDLRKTFSNIKKDKELLIIAMKSVFYLTDSQIEKICNYYKLNKTDFYKTIEFYKINLTKKNKRKEEVLTRRNNAYYCHKKYQRQLELLEQKDFSEEKVILKNHLLEKDERHYKIWLNLTTQLNSGLQYVRPSNKIIADVLGICERQVIYYLKRAKKKAEKQKENDLENV